MHLLLYVQLVCIILTISISASNSVRSQRSKCLHPLKPQVGCVECSPPYDEATKEIENALSTARNGACALANTSSYPANYHPTNMEKFDYIVVGAGTAGSVVANRLTEIPGCSVLLLEAGGNPTKTSEVPALFASLQQTSLDWQYKTDPNEDNCLGMNENMCNLPRGKVLGGSSTINYMVYTTGNAKDYDDWAAEGNTGWEYEEVLPYFKKMEDMRDKKVQESSDFNIYHNKGGPQTAEAWPNKEVKSVAISFAEGMNELGYPVNYDINGPTQSGYVKTQGTLENGKRCSTAKAYLTPARRRKNLKDSKYSLVTKVLLNDKKTAYGVQFLNKRGHVVTVRARKEVILSAGAINTPQLMMLSGIGPGEHLQEFNISVVQDLPVGLNLQDHAAMSGLVITLDFDKPIEYPESILDFILKNDSIYSSLGLNTYISMINVSSTSEEVYPDVEFITSDFAQNDKAKLSRFLDVINLREENKKDFLNIIKNSYMIIVWNCLLTPLSRGRIELRSNDPKEYPKINTGYYTNQNDIDIQLKAYEFIDSLVKTKGLRKRNAKVHEIKIAACMQYPFGTKTYRVCALRHLTTTLYHQCGTCKMGPADALDSVVDPQLRVKGIQSLRVVDASVMPKIPRGHTAVPVIMVAEKASDLIKGSWKSQSDK